MEKIILAAVSENNVIGFNGKMPWHIPKDMERFKALTIRHPVIMGRKIYESLGKPLDQRMNIILTRTGAFNGERITLCSSLGNAFDIAKVYNEIVQDFHQFSEEEDKHESKVYIIGGAEIYRQTLGLVDRLDLTRVHQNFRGDTYFPKVNWNVWRQISKEDFPASDGIPSFSFESYVRI